jgi:hypothetical protein
LGRRRVVFRPGFRRHKALNPHEQADFLEVADAVKHGKTLDERFYRPAAGHQDDLLERYGVLHLHLDGDTSDTLLFLMQFPDRVVLLETNTHKRFWNDSQQFIQSHKLAPIPKPVIEHKKPPRFPRK